MKKTLFLLLFVTLPAFASTLKITNPYVRLMPPTSPTTGAFMVIENTSAKEVKLIKAESDICNLVELHTHKMEDGVMKMREVKNMPIPAKGKTTLKPGSLHVMLIGLKNPLKLNQKVAIKLTFDNGEKVDVQAVVQKIKPMKGMMKHH